MPAKLLVVLISLFVAGVLALLCAFGAFTLAREEKKSLPVALRSSFSAMIATMTVLIAMVGVVVAVV
ncbi:hypothetical protein [Nocardiopsis listeri]|uniref:hypothetical protein n=1 Tax=Nocardiopsis listeri TaxID=53440 RepID=UPI00082D3674|nr:hypothetical protein [Nocardiopsis listeri]